MLKQITKRGRKLNENNNKILHYPNLRTVIMVEEAIEKHGTITKTSLFKSLNNKVMWQTFDVILDYLYSKRLIVRDKEGKIVWIHNPKLRKRYENRDDLRVRL